VFHALVECRAEFPDFVVLLDFRSERLLGTIESSKRRRVCEVMPHFARTSPCEYCHLLLTTPSVVFLFATFLSRLSELAKSFLTRALALLRSFFFLELEVLVFLSGPHDAPAHHVLQVIFIPFQVNAFPLGSRELFCLDLPGFPLPQEEAIGRTMF